MRDALVQLPETTSSSGASEDRLGLFDAIVPFVLAVAHERPLLLVFDDLQRADRASLALLRHLARYLADSAMLVVFTSAKKRSSAASHSGLTCCRCCAARHPASSWFCTI